MALSLGSGRRRWPCRAARRGGKRGAGCRHFHVHYHFPRQVCAFSSLQLPPSFSLLTFLLILPVLFLAVLAFLVCFVWFTLVYFVYSLLGKCNSPECLESDRDANELCRNEEQARNEEEIAENSVAQGTGSSTMAEACIEGQGIKEVCVDGFSDASLYMSRMASPYDCTKDEEHSSCEKIVEEVMVFETKEDNRAEASGTTSSVCDLAESNQEIREEVGVPSTEDNIHELASGKSSVIGRIEDEDKNSCTSEGGPPRLPRLRRSQPPWWNLCGVLDVFAGCNED